MRKISTLFIAILFLLTLSLVPVFADEHTSESSSGDNKGFRRFFPWTNSRNDEDKSEKRKEFEEKKTEMQEKREEFKTDRCELVTTNIDTRITRFENNFEGHKKFYEKMKEIVSNFISKAKEKGKDTAALEEDLATLQGKLDNFSSHKAAHIEDLKATQEYACGESDGAFKAALEKARDSFKVLREDVSDIRNFYQTKIRADIKALRAEKETSNE